MFVLDVVLSEYNEDFWGWKVLKKTHFPILHLRT